MSYTRHHLERRALPRPVTAEKGHSLAFLDLERQVFARIDASQKRALAVVIENAKKATTVVFVEIIRLGHVVELDDNLVAHARFYEEILASFSDSSLEDIAHLLVELLVNEQRSKKGDHEYYSEANTTGRIVPEPSLIIKSTTKRSNEKRNGVEVK